MSDSPTSSPRLLRIEFGGFSLFNGLLVAIALSFVTLQVFSIMDGFNPDKSLFMQFVPLLIALLIILLVIQRSRRKGYLEAYPDRIEGKRANGLAIDIPIAAIGSVEVKPNGLVIKDEAGKIKLLQRLPGKTDGGIVYLLKACEDWESAIWAAYPSAGLDSLLDAQRHFLSDADEPSFGDFGFVIQHAGNAYYFPESQIYDIQGLGTGQLRMNQRASGQKDTIMQFQPAPDALPLGQLCAAMIAAQLGPDRLSDLLSQLADHHGGTISPVQAAAQHFEGECLGHKVKISLAE